MPNAYTNSNTPPLNAVPLDAAVYASPHCHPANASVFNHLPPIPERLLTGERPEPTFLITKPFQPETVKAAIGQALFFHPRRASKQAA